MKSLKQLLILPLVLLLTATPTYGQGNSGDDGITLGYTPTSEYLILQPGEEYSSKFTAWNLYPKSEKYTVLIRGFKQVENYPGTSIPNNLEQEKLDPYSAASWTTVEQEIIEMTPNKNIDIKYRINVPEDAAIGEYHLKIFLTTDTDLSDTESNLAITNLGMGPAILIRVGDQSQINESLELLQFTTDKKRYNTPEINFKTVLQNSGNTHVLPQGDIVLYNFLGQEIERINFNSESRSIIRDTTAHYLNFTKLRKILNKNKHITFGPIDAKLLITYRSENPGFAPIKAETSFWVIPWELIIVILFLFILTGIYASSTSSQQKRKKG